ncbi:glutamate--tRNA ligase [Bacteroidia bacterium]|nr:glutamate--tRNA ligase [Bacteroidia bacterium]
MAPKVRTRFAPSPTGFMHIGNLRTALYAYLFAKSKGGDFVLRIEDTDQARYVEGATDVIYNTLRASNLPHDEGPDVGGNYAPYVQSERKQVYKQYALQLIERGEAYYCFCSKQELEQRKTEEGYDRHCRHLTAAEVQHNLSQGKPYVIRQKVPVDGLTSFEDAVFGEITVDNKTLDDQVLLKSDGLPTYNFANVVDDHLMQISHILRGSEYLSSNPKYILLYKAFGWDVPQFIHLPLIMGKNDDGSVTKLSKRHGATGFQELVDNGYLPSAIINYIALLGWSPKNDRELFTMPQLIEAFLVEGINKSPAVFDYQKLDWMNGEHIKLLPFDQFCTIALPFANIQDTPLADKWREIAALLQSRLHRLSQIPQMIAFLHQVAPYDTQLFVNQKNKSTLATSVDCLNAALTVFNSLQEWNADTLYAAFSELAQSKGIKFGQVMWAPRIALSGLLVTPGGAIEIMSIIGKPAAVQRVESALQLLMGK